MDEMNNNEVMEEVTQEAAETVAAEAAPAVDPQQQAQAVAQAIAQTAPAPSAVQAAVAETEAKFTPEEQAKIDQFAQTIDVSDTTMVLQYGVGAQQKLAEFSESALNSVKTQDLGQVGDLLSDLVTEIKTSGEEKKGIFGMFQSAEKKLEHKKAQYAAAEKNVDKRTARCHVKKDIHEKDTEYLERCAEAARYVSGKLGWTVIDCAKDGVQLDRDEIFSKIFSALSL